MGVMKIQLITMSGGEVLLNELQNKPTESTLLKLQNIFHLQTPSKRQRSFGKQGPFAWSVLIQILKIESPNSWEILAKISWLCCQVLQRVEFELNLEKWDFERLLCNLCGKLLDMKQWSFACAVSSFLFERLRLDESNERSLEDKSEFRLGKAFLEQSPIFQYFPHNEQPLILILKCQLFWIRLFCNDISNLNYNLLEETLFNPYGGFLHLLSKVDKKSKSKFLESVLFHWRIFVHTQRDQKLLNLERKILNSIEDLDLEFSLILKWRSLCFYSSTDLDIKELFDGRIDVFTLKNAEEFLSKLKGLDANGLLRLAEISKKNELLNFLLTLINEMEFGYIPNIDTCDCLRKINVSSSFEFEFSRICGRFISNSTTIITTNDQVSIKILKFLCNYEEVRHEITMKVFDGLIRLITRRYSPINDDLIFDASKRLIRLGKFFNKMEAVNSTILTLCKVLPIEKATKLQAFSPTLDNWLITLQRAVDHGKPCTFPAELDAEHMLSVLPDKLPHRYWNAALIDLPPKYFQNASLLMLKCKYAGDHAVDWISKGEQHQYLRLIWSYVAKQNVDISDLPTTFVDHETGEYLQPLIALLKGPSEIDHVPSPQANRNEFDQLIDQIKNAHITYLPTLWKYYQRLLIMVDNLILDSLCLGSRRLTMYFIKVGMTYSDAVRSNGWRKRFSFIQENLENPERLCRSFEKSEYQIANIKVPKVLENVSFFPSLLASPALDMFIEEIFEGGTIFQCRQMVCKMLLAMNDPMKMMNLMHRLFQREFGISKLSLIDDTNQHLTIFIDFNHDFLYVGTNLSPLVNDCGPLLVRTKLSKKFVDFEGEFESLLKENTLSLFKADQLPTDNATKRAWWQNRYDMEQRLKSLIKELDDWLLFGRPLLECYRELPLPSGLRNLKSPNNWSSTSKLLSALKETDLIKSELLFGVGFGSDDVDLIIKLMSGRARDEEMNPFELRQPNASKKFLNLILDPHLHRFPWEMTETLNNFIVIRSLSPCSSKVLSISKVSAVINPTGDLIKTQELFSSLLAKLIGDNELIQGRAPTKDELKNLIISKDLYLYFGHGSGESFLPLHELSTLKISASAFLFGCSSGGLKFYSQNFSPEGTLVSYSTGGSPILLANLWDVTDKDIDKLSEKFLLRFSPGMEENIVDLEIAKWLGESRGCCLLKFLNGAAPVIYRL